MQEHRYKVQNNKIVGQSWLIGLFVLICVGLAIYTGSQFLATTNYLILLLPNLAFATVAICGIYIFLNYIKHSRHKEFVITYESLKLIDKRTNNIIELKKSDIKSVERYANYAGSRFPWLFYEYFCFKDNTNKRIVVTSFIMDINDFWQDTLSRQISADKLVTFKIMFPTIPK